MYMLDVYVCQASASLTEARRALRILWVTREWWIAPSRRDLAGKNRPIFRELGSYSRRPPCLGESQPFRGRPPDEHGDDLRVASRIVSYSQLGLKWEKICCARRSRAVVFSVHPRQLYPHGAMIPQHAIADCERPLKCAFAAGGAAYPGRAKCYESFTLMGLWFGGVPRIFALVMTGRKPTSRTTSRGVFSAHAQARANNFAPRQLSAQNVLSLTSDLRLPTSANRQLPTAN